jgi:hypothetical protein
MPYDLETQERAVKRLAGPCRWRQAAAYTGWHAGLEALARTLYDHAGLRGRLALLLIRWIARGLR